MIKLKPKSTADGLSLRGYTGVRFGYFRRDFFTVNIVLKNSNKNNVALIG